MDKNTTGGNAFPYTWDCTHNPTTLTEDGMTLLDYFAAKAMAALIVHYGGLAEHTDRAYYMASLMIEERKKYMQEQ